MIQNQLQQLFFKQKWTSKRRGWLPTCVTLTFLRINQHQSTPISINHPFTHSSNHSFIQRSCLFWNTLKPRTLPLIKKTFRFSDFLKDFSFSDLFLKNSDFQNFLIFLDFFACSEKETSSIGINTQHLKKWAPPWTHQYWKISLDFPNWEIERIQQWFNFAPLSAKGLWCRGRLERIKRRLHCRARSWWTARDVRHRWWWGREQVECH